MQRILDKEIIALREALAYDAHTGCLTWRVDRPRSHFATMNAYHTYLGRFAGTAAGAVHRTKTGNYISVRVNSKLYLAHRLIFAMLYGCWPEDLVDHLNGNGTDNRLENLRKVSRIENNRNCAMKHNNTSGYNGVYFHTTAGRWAATGGSHHLGLFDTAELAASFRASWQDQQQNYTERHGKGERNV